MKKFLVIFISLILILTGCGKTEEVSQIKPENQSITIVSTDFPFSMDPAKGDDSPNCRLQSLIGETLVDFDNQTYQYVPALAEDWYTKDNKTYTFIIRNGVNFHNGKTVTVEDVKYTFERLLNSKQEFVSAGYLSIINGAKEKMEGKASEVSGIKVKDKNTIEISLVYPQAGFIGLLTYPAYSIVDKNEVEKQKETYGNPGTVLSGAGRYKVASLTDKEVRLTRFDGFYGNKPQIKDLKYITEPKNLVQQFNEGKIDCIVTLKTLPELKQYESELVKAGTGFFHFNFKDTIWNNKKLRKAVFYAVDKEKLARIMNFQTADGFVPKVIPGYKPIGEKIYDVDMAKKLLSEAGYPNGKGLPQIEIHDKNNGEPDNQISYEIQKDLEKIGIKSKVVLENDFDYTHFQDSSDIIVDGWVLDYPDISSMLEPILMSDSPSNVGHYINKQLDSLLLAARKEINNNKRFEIYNTINKIINEEAPIVPYGWLKKKVYVNSRLQGVKFEFNDELVTDGLWLK